jgi:hypothetical protein
VGESAGVIAVSVVDGGEEEGTPDVQPAADRMSMMTVVRTKITIGLIAFLFNIVPDSCCSGISPPRLLPMITFPLSIYNLLLSSDSVTSP